MLCFKTAFFQGWQNEFLTWNSSDFCGINTLTIPTSNLWIPDINIQEEYVFILTPSYNTTAEVCGSDLILKKAGKLLSLWQKFHQAKDKKAEEKMFSATH